MGLETFFQFGKPQNEHVLQSAAQDAYSEDQSLQTEINRLDSVYRRNPEKISKSIMLLEEVIGYKGQDPETRGRAFYNLATCFLSVAACKARFDPVGARMVLHGTAAGRMTPDQTGTSRGYDGAFDSINRAKQLIPNDRRVLRTEKMLKLLDKQLSKR